VIGSPIKGSSLAPLLKLAGFRFNAWFIFKFYGVFRWIMRYLYSPLISRDPRFPKMMDSDLTRLSLQSFMTSIATLRKTDLRPSLGKVAVPVMGMYGDKDIIVSPHEWQTLLGGIPQARIERFPKAGHFIMLDDSQRFREVIRDFLDKKV
jgi:pimeloyl-ACP methyl ester carboxylesterase